MLMNRGWAMDQDCFTSFVIHLCSTGECSHNKGPYMSPLAVFLPIIPHYISLLWGEQDNHNLGCSFASCPKKQKTTPIPLRLSCHCLRTAKLHKTHLSTLKDGARAKAAKMHQLRWQHYKIRDSVGHRRGVLLRIWASQTWRCGSRIRLSTWIFIDFPRKISSNRWKNPSSFGVLPPDFRW